MNAKMKADFINSVAAGKMIPCPKCDSANTPGSKCCAVCGASLVSKGVAFDSVDEQVTETVQEVPVFAEGLPDWDIVPPQIMVKRR